MKTSKLLLLILCAVLPIAAFGQARPTVDNVPATLSNKTQSGCQNNITNVNGINVCSPAYGATGNTLSYGDGTVTASSTAFSSASATFTSADVGKTIIIDYAGAAGVPLVTTISAFVDSHDVTLAAAASVSVPYKFVWAMSPQTLQSGAGSYAPGDTITLTGGTVTTNAIGTVIATSAVSATQTANGSSGATNTGVTSGACQVQGTTGTGVKFILNTTLTAAAISAIGTFVNKGQYTVNPTTLTAEPVTPTNGCTGLTGATVNVVMGGKIVQPSTRGVYSVLPTSPVSQGSTSGSGTGITVNVQSVTAGAFEYGTDDTTALTAAWNAEIAALAAGQLGACLYMPAGHYLLSSPLPVFHSVNGCARGQGWNQTWLIISPALSGTAISFSEDWQNNSLSANGGISQFTGQNSGPILSDFTMQADRNSANTQNAIMFFDRNDYIALSHLFLQNFNGTCLGSGTELNAAQAYIRESNFDNLKAWYCGNSTSPAVLFDSCGSGDATNEVKIDDLDIFAFFGTGLQFRADSSSSVRNIEIGKLRIEGIQFDPVTIAADEMVIGDTAETSIVDTLTCRQCEFIDPLPGQYAIRLDGASSATASYFIDLEGVINGGEVWGSGLYINYGRNNRFNFQSLQTTATNVTLTNNAGGGNMIYGPGKAEQSWTYSIGSAGVPVSYPILVGSPLATTTYFSTTLPDSTLAGGNTPGQGTINMGLSRGAAYQVASGNQAIIIGGANNQATSTYSTVVGGANVAMAGTYSGSIGGNLVTDNGWYGAQYCQASGSLTDFNGDANYCPLVIRCQAAATNGSTCRATSDNAAAGSANTVDIRAGSIYALTLDCSAQDRGTTTKSSVWNAWTGEIDRSAAAATTHVVMNTTPTPLSNGTVTGIGVAASADTANGGLNITFTAPSTNADLWDFTCHVGTHQAK